MKLPAYNNPVSDLDDSATTALLQDHEHPTRLRGTPPVFQEIPQTKHLTWTDTYYDGKPGVIAVFDRDMERAANAFAKHDMLRTVLFIAFAILNFAVAESAFHYYVGASLLMLAGIWSVTAWRGRQIMMTLHVAVSTEGIRCDSGWVTLTIPFYSIQKLVVKPYKFCCKADSLSSKVVVHHGPAPMEKFYWRATEKFELHGIVRVQEFLDLVMTLKDSRIHGTYEGSNTTASEGSEILKGTEQRANRIPNVQSV